MSELRPIFIVGPARSGVALLFEALAISPSVWTADDGLRDPVAACPRLRPEHREWSSERLTARDLTPEAAQAYRTSMLAGIRNRDDAQPSGAEAELVLLERVLANSLRVSFLAELFPDARFVHVQRDPVQTVASAIEAWESGRFASPTNLPDWVGPRWSFALVPGWRELSGQPVERIAAIQWRRTRDILSDDLAALDGERVATVAYPDLTADPQATLTALAERLGIGWDRQLTAPLAFSRATVSLPEPGKWQRRRPGLDQRIAAVTDEPHVQSGTGSTAATEAPPSTAVQERARAFSSSYTPLFPKLLAELGATLLVSTYQSGLVIAFREDRGTLNTHLLTMNVPMGMARNGPYLLIGTKTQVLEYQTHPTAKRMLADAERYDTCFLPRNIHITGDIGIHELAFAAGTLWLVSTRFSCLGTLNGSDSFVPRWHPPFISALTPEDRCHLNGLAIAYDEPRFVTALAETDTRGGWRDTKGTSGLIMDVRSGETIVRGLSMPHSPRWHNGRLWVLESGKGTIATVDPARGEVTTVAELPGFTRGLAFAGRYAFIGLSQVRESVFRGLPISQRQDRISGVAVVDVSTGGIVAVDRFQGLIQEIFDVQLLDGIRFPEFAAVGSDMSAENFHFPVLTEQHNPAVVPMPGAAAR